MIDIRSAAFWRATLALCLGSFTIFSNVYVTQPLLPTLAEHFHVSPLMAGWSFTVTTLMLGLSLLVYGPLSDAVGRRPLMIFTMGAATLVTVAICFVESFHALLILRALQGFFLGGLPAIAIAYMGDEFTKRALVIAVGYYISGNSLGGIGGRLIGGFMGDIAGWQSAFVFIAIMSVVLIPLWLISGAMFPKPDTWVGHVMTVNPMTYAVDAMRACLAGGSSDIEGTSSLMLCTLVLTGFAVAGFLLSATLANRTPRGTA